MPKAEGIEPAIWWRGLLTTAYLTGWRINEILTLKQSALDLSKGEAILEALDNKARRQERIALHPVAVDHMKALDHKFPFLFHWPHNEATLYSEFHRIQSEADIHLDCQKKHDHTDTCHVYGFHDLRRSFASMNADRLTPDTLQELMRHKSYETTKVYINITRQMDEAVQKLYVPDFLKTTPDGEQEDASSGENLESSE